MAVTCLSIEGSAWRTDRPPQETSSIGGAPRGFPRRAWKMNGSWKLLFWCTAWLVVTLWAAVAQADALDARDTLLVDAATAGTPIPKEFGRAEEVDSHQEGKTISAYVLHPVASFVALGIGSTFDDRRSLDPSPSVRVQLLSQQQSGLNLTAVFRFKSSGVFPGTQEGKAGRSAGRDFGKMDVLANVAVGTTVKGDEGTYLEMKMSAGWRLDQEPRVSLDARMRADLVDHVENTAASPPDARDFDLLTGPALSWTSGVVHLQGLAGVTAPKGTTAIGAV